MSLDDPAHEFARRCVEDAWRPGHRRGLLACTTRRPGRGRSLQSSNRAGWRIEDRRSALAAFERLVSTILLGLRSGTLSAAAARAEIEAAGFAQASHVAESPPEMAERLASAVRSGDNVRVDCSADDDPVLFLRFQEDHSHCALDCAGAPIPVVVDLVAPRTE